MKRETRRDRKSKDDKRVRIFETKRFFIFQNRKFDGLNYLLVSSFSFLDVKNFFDIYF